jgi:hypothetical protein
MSSRVEVFRKFREPASLIFDMTHRCTAMNATFILARADFAGVWFECRSRLFKVTARMR